MYAEKHTVAITTNSGGIGTGYSPALTGRLLSVQYVKTDYADGVDVAITAEATGQSLLTLTDQNGNGTFYPRGQVHMGNGTPMTFNGNSSQPMSEPVTLVNDRVKIAIAQGGDTKLGTFVIIVG